MYSEKQTSPLQQYFLTLSSLRTCQAPLIEKIWNYKEMWANIKGIDILFITATNTDIRKVIFVQR